MDALQRYDRRPQPPRQRGTSLAPVIALALLAMIPAIALGYLWRWAEDKHDADSRDAVVAAVESPMPPALSTPLLSVRRAPQTLARVSSESGLVANLNDLAVFVPDTSCVVVALDGRVILNDGGDTKVTPASNEKLLVATVALQGLGADYTFTTSLKGTVSDGVVQGDLFFVGGGDPLLSTADYPTSGLEAHPPTVVTSLETLVADLVAAGVTRVSGNVIADESRYDQERYVPTWADDIKNVEAGPLGALMVNDAQKRNSAGAILTAPSRENDPSIGAAKELIRLLRASNIIVGGTARTGVAPPEATDIASVQSPPLSAIIGEMLTTSDDNTAELLVKELAVHYQTGNTRQAGLDVISSTLLTLGVDTTQLTLTDGSGLDSSNVVTCNILLQVLSLNPLDGPIGAGLPVAGQTGTLVDQFLDTDMVGRLHAKTGTLTNAKSLTGYVTTTAGTITFSMILNYPRAGAADEPGNYTAIWNALANALGGYPSGPAVEQLQPR